MKKKFLAILLCLILLVGAVVTLVACDPDDSFTVKFEGDGIQLPDQTVESGSTAEKPSDPSRTGYDFGGWLYGGGVFDFNTPITEDITLTAKWTAKTYTVTLDVNGGSALTDTVKNVNYGESYNLGVAEKARYEFAGWMLEDGTLLTNSAGASLSSWSFTENKTVKAKWAEGVIQSNGLKYTLLEDETWSVTSIQGYSYPDKFVIPSEYDGSAITKIESLSHVQSYEVVIPASVKEICASALAHNLYVDIVDMSAFSGTIGEGAFEGSAVKVINLGATKVIEKNAFANANVSIFVIPASVNRIGEGAFNSNKIVEIDFAGSFPTLGNAVFGDGTRTGDYGLNISASSDAWDALTNGASPATFNEAVRTALGLSRNANAFFYELTDEEVAHYVANAGAYSVAGGNVIYKGFGLYATMYCFEDMSATTLELFADTHVYIENENGLRDTYLFNAQTKNADLLTMNANGETIHQGVLYDYQGTSLAYVSPDEVTEIAAGAVQSNSYLTFVVLGDNVTAVGDFAFANGELMGVRFGTNLESIGNGAFINQYYLLEAVFAGANPPEIGNAAFCNVYYMNNNAYYVPTFLFNELVREGDYSFIYTQYAHNDETNLAPWVEAFNGTLNGLTLMPTSNDVEISYVAGVGGLFNKINDRTGFTLGYEHDLSFGTLIMSGASNNSGYAILVFDEDSDYEGTSFVYYEDAPGYGGTADINKALKKFTVFYGVTQDKELLTFNTYGIFNSEEGYIARGEEGGTHGSLDGDLIYLDGFGKYMLYAADGSIEQGTYDKEGGTITLESGLTATFDSATKSLTFNGHVLKNSVGEEAGVYYDLGNGAKLEVDATPFKTEDGNFSGTLTFTYDGETYEFGYFFRTSINICFDYIDENTVQGLTYSRTSDDYILAGRITLGTHEETYFSFKLEIRGLAGMFTNADGDTIELDGFANATVKVDDNDAVSGTYTFFGDTSNVLVLVGEEAYVAILNTEDKSFSFATAPEAGTWYVADPQSKGLYLDGAGHSIYYYGSSVYQGSYEYNVDDNTILTHVRDSVVQTTWGTLNIEQGYGFTVCNINYATTTKSLISRAPFLKFGSSISKSSNFYGIFLKDDNSIGNKQISYAVYYSNGHAFVKVSNSWAVIDVAELVDGTSFQSTHDWEWASGNKTQITLDINVTVSSGNYSIGAQLANYYEEIETATYKSKTVNVYTIVYNDTTYMAVVNDNGYPNFVGGGEPTRNYTESATGAYVKVGDDYVLYNEAEHDGLKRYSCTVSFVHETSSKTFTTTVTNYGEDNATVTQTSVNK